MIARSALSSLHIAVRNADLNTIKTLLTEYPALVSGKDEHMGYTALHQAAQQNRLDALELLLVHGADIETTTRRGSTPLHLATFCGHPSAVESLLANGADDNAKDDDGRTPLEGLLNATYWRPPRDRVEAVEALFRKRRDQKKEIPPSATTI